MTICALSCHDNAVHPNKEYAAKANETFEKACLLAEELGVDTIVEIGPGRALSGFVKKTVGDAITCLPAEDVPTLTAALEALVAKAAP